MPSLYARVETNPAGCDVCSIGFTSDEGPSLARHVNDAGHKTCTQYRTCGPKQWQTAGPTLTSNRECEDWRVCHNDACADEADWRDCSSTEFESEAPGAYQNRKCTKHATCDLDGSSTGTTHFVSKRAGVCVKQCMEFTGALHGCIVMSMKRGKSAGAMLLCKNFVFYELDQKLINRQMLFM